MSEKTLQNKPTIISNKDHEADIYTVKLFFLIMNQNLILL